jgi:hypothetical protein
MISSETNLLVGANTSGFESLGTQLFIFVRNEMDAEREVINTSSLSSKIENSDLRIGYTTVESGFWVWLFHCQFGSSSQIISLEEWLSWESTDLVLAVTVTSSWTAGHLD